MRRDANEILKTATVEFALKCNVAFKHCPKTIAEASAVFHFARTGSNAQIHDAFDHLHSSTSVGRHARILDDAVDRYCAEFVAQRREKSFFGFAFASDESPPQGNRWSGLRFQITYVYFLEFQPIERWAEYGTEFPFTRHRWLCDICHCDGKSGAIVSKVLDKQFERKGLYRIDCTAGSGDGGGENEGFAGVHSVYEASCDGYVRHRCLGHLAWRVHLAASRESCVERSCCNAIGRHVKEKKSLVQDQTCKLQHQPPAPLAQIIKSNQNSNVGKL